MAGSLTFLGGCAVSVGLWLTADSKRVEKPCPTAWERGGSVRTVGGDHALYRVKLPQYCIAFESGVLLTRDSYLAMEIKIAELTEHLRLARERERLLEEERQRLLRDLRACHSKGDGEWCPVWLYIVGGALGGYGAGKL